MSKYKILRLVSIFSFMILFSLAFMVNVSDLQVLTNKYNEAQITELCSPVKNGLKFCTDQQRIIIIAGDPVVLNFTVKNVVEEEFGTTATRNISSNYNLKVTDENGKIIATKIEQISKKGNLMNEQEKRDFILSLVTNHRSKELQSNQVLNEKFSLSDIYNFTNVGRYYLEITRMTMNSSKEESIEISLGKIEIEVKGENE